MGATTARSATAVSQRDDRSYRSYLTFDATPDAVALAVQQVAGWLRGKRYGDDLDLTASGFTRVSPAAELVVVHHATQHLHTFRVRLTETDPAGEGWTTSIAMASPEKGSGWLSIRVSHSGRKAAARPRIAMHLIEVLRLSDSGYEAVAGAPVIRPEGVDDLLDAVCDPDRNGLLFVAGTDPADPGLFSAFAARVAKWADGTHGMAQAVVLDPAATLAFNAAIGETHAAPPWTIRTYLPDVDPAWEPDARRHRILGTRRLARENDGVIRAILNGAARAHAATRELPSAAQTVLRNLNRIEDRLLLDPLLETAAVSAEIAGTGTETVAPAQPAEATTEAEAVTGGPDTQAPPTTPPDEPAVAEPATARPAETAPEAAEPSVADAAAEYLRLRDLLHDTLGVDDLTETSVRTALDRAIQTAAHDAAARAAEHTAQVVRDEYATREAHRQEITGRVSRELAERQKRIDALEDELARTREAADESVIAQSVADADRLRAEDEVRWLRDMLRDQGRYDDAFAALPEDRLTSVPESFDDLVDRYPELEARGVVVTGDERITLGLLDQDTLGSMAQVAWECLLVLSDYVAAKQAGAFSGGLKQYLQNTPQGYRTISKNRFGETESSSTLNQWGNERVFPVPSEVGKDGDEVLMDVHFKLPRCGMVTPRMHFYDDTHGTGKVYVGYIGPHLRTRDTN